MLRKRRQIATGIDIGSKAIKIAQIRRDRNGLVLSNWTVINIAEHLKGGRLIQLSPESLSQLIKTELRKRGISIINPAIATSAEDILFKYFFIPKSVKKRIFALLRLIVSPIPTPELTFGFCRINGISRSKKNDLIMVGVAKDNVLEFMYRLHKDIGDRINHSVPRVIAMYNLVTFTDIVEDGMVYLCADIGSESLDMAIILKTNPQRPTNGLAFFRSVRLKSLENINASGPSGTDSQPGYNPAAHSAIQTTNPINAMHNNIYDEIQQTTLSCQRELKLSRLDISQYLITGERCYTDGLQEFLNKRLGKDVRRLEPITAIGLKVRDKAISSGNDFRNSEGGMGKNDEPPICITTAIGLALGMLVKLPIYIRLEPRLVEIERKKLKNLGYLKAAMIMVLVAASLILYHGYYSRKVYRDNVEMAERALSLYVSNEGRILGMAEGQKKLGEGLQRLKAITERDFSKDVLLKFLGVEPPPEIAIKAIDIITPGGFQTLDPGRWVLLAGEVKGEGGEGNHLESIKTYVTRLEGVNGFERVKFREIREQGDQSATFQIEFLTSN